MTEKDSKKEYWLGVGRRKTAVAVVKIFLGLKTSEINGSKVELDDATVTPFELVGKKGSFGVIAKVLGGGKESQSDAIRLGISRALEKFDPEFRTSLKKAGFLTRDPREKERKKPGLRGARRAPQWAKR
ncbi:MAG: 30S ribosomal protein S9 [Patescibacteria group bacterium]